MPHQSCADGDLSTTHLQGKLGLRGKANLFTPFSQQLAFHFRKKANFMLDALSLLSSTLLLQKISLRAHNWNSYKKEHAGHWQNRLWKSKPSPRSWELHTAPVIQQYHVLSWLFQKALTALWRLNSASHWWILRCVSWKVRNSVCIVLPSWNASIYHDSTDLTLFYPRVLLESTVISKYCNRKMKIGRGSILVKSRTAQKQNNQVTSICFNANAASLLIGY